VNRLAVNHMRPYLLRETNSLMNRDRKTDQPSAPFRSAISQGRAASIPAVLVLAVLPASSTAPAEAGPFLAVKGAGSANLVLKDNDFSRAGQDVVLGPDVPPAAVKRNPSGGWQHPGVRDRLPVFRERVAERLTFPLSWPAWKERNGDDFERWRKETRARVRERFLAAPPAAPFAPEIVSSRKRDGFTAHKITFNLTADSRVLACLLVPDGTGPHPAVLMLHDHGAEFRIGKEKSVEPWDAPTEKTAVARKWVEKVYGGRFVGDELAARGYVVLVYDALNWSDRGGAGYDGQQALASNLLHLGMSFAGLIAHEDLRGAEFLASRPEVDKSRIAAMGHSMGCFRAWQVAAMSDHIAAGVCCCWMATVKSLMVPGNNQTKGQSAFTMTHPGLFNDLDYPDVASLACPKPMLFFAGEQDKLFPVPGVREAFAKMREVWKSRGAGDMLTTRLLPVPHQFNAAMQDEAFEWLDRQLRPQTTNQGQPKPRG